MRTWAIVLLLVLGIIGFGCNSSIEIPCPAGTHEVDGLCTNACSTDDECLVSEVCIADLGACMPAAGDKPEIIRFTAGGAAITSGRPARIEYAVKNARTVEITGGLLPQTSTLEGSVMTGALTAKMTIALIARGSGGRTTQHLEIDVADAPSAPAIIDFSATPNPVPRGGFATLAWSVGGADGIAIKKKNDGSLIHSSTDGDGSVAYFPSSAVVLVLVATNELGVVERELRVDYDAPGPQIVDFGASASAVIPGANVELHWSTASASTLSIRDESGTELFSTTDKDVIGTGELMVPIAYPNAPAGGRAIFELHVSDGMIEAAPMRIDLAVRNAPEIESFTAISRQSDVELSWEISRASGIDLFVDQSAVPPQAGVWPLMGEATVAGSGSPAIELVARNDAGSVRERRRVWQIADERENNDSSANAERIGMRAVRNACRNDVADQHDWFELDAGQGGGGAQVTISDGAGACPDFAFGTILELYRDGARLGAVRYDDQDTCPVIDPRVHAFARDLSPQGGAVLVHVVQPAGSGCGPYVLTAEMIARACGNGIVENGETCDDGNTLSGDGCTPGCAIERGSNYTVSAPTPFTYQRAPGESVPFASYDGRFSASDEGVAELALPFSFTFFGRTYDSVHVYTDGYISFGGFVPSSATDDDPQPMPSRAPTDAVIAALWSDLLIDAGTAGSPSRIVTHASGTAPNRKFIVDYQNVRTYDELEANYVRASAQIVLEEGTNSIELRYGDRERVGGANELLFAGIENHQGRFGIAATEACAAGCSLDANALPRNQVIRFDPR